jgi:DNA-directed RNA polymerase subunit RPC12/RpoP
LIEGLTIEKMNTLLDQIHRIVAQAGIAVPTSEGATVVHMSHQCRSCGQTLTLEEMHWYDAGDGTASCNQCESRWMVEMARWKEDGHGPMPERP